MKKSIYLLSIWVLCSSFTPLDFFKEWYDYYYAPFEIAPFAIPGAVGNGIANDTAAIQAWLDSGSPGNPNGNETYLISGQLDIDQSGLQVIDFNGATITSNTDMTYFFVVDKPSGATNIRNVSIDGNNIVAEGIDFRSYGNGQNINVYDMYAQINTGNAIGLKFRISSDVSTHGQYLFENCNLYNIKSESNGVIGDGNGAARSVMMNYLNNQNGSSIKFIGGSFHDVWGDDGDLIQVQDDDQTPNSTMLTQFIGVTMYNADRRYLKGTGANIELIACNIQTTLGSHPEQQDNDQTGFLSFGMVGDGLSNPGYGHRLINNTIDMTGSNRAQFGLILPTKTTDFVINGNTITGVTINLFRYFTSWNVTGVKIINNTFSNSDMVSNNQYGNNYVGLANNTGLTNNLQSNEWYTITSPDPAPTCSDGIQNQGESGVDTGGPCGVSSPTCSDGIQNGDETGVDCGGSCDPCAVSASSTGILTSRRRSF